MHTCSRTRSFTGVILLSCTLAAILMPMRANAALDAFAVIIGETQGEIESDVTEPGREGQIRIKAFGSSVSADYETATGLPGTGRQHRPIRLLKDVDITSPQLLAAFKNNERLLTVTLRFFQPSQSGAEENHITIVLENAFIVSVLPGHSSQTEDSTTPFRETISLTYESMTVTWESSGHSTQVLW